LASLFHVRGLSLRGLSPAVDKEQAVNIW
jgi:hypothetical protein